MRIGEPAELVGVTTRTVRHYHHLGLLPEPSRQANGYREYGLRDAVGLARVRRLAELGLSLDEIADVLADDQDRELREVLQELDADLAYQQQAIQAQRERLAVLLAQLDRELFTLIATATSPQAQTRVATLFRRLTEPAALARGQALYARLDDLAEADPGDPLVGAQVTQLAADVAARLPADLADAVASALTQAPGQLTQGTDQAPVQRWLDAVTDLLTPAQAEVIRQVLTRLMERQRWA